MDGDLAPRWEGEAVLGGAKGLVLRWRLRAYEDFQLAWALFADGLANPITGPDLSPINPRAAIDLWAVFQDPHIEHGQLELRYDALCEDPRLIAGGLFDIKLWCHVPLSRSSWYTQVVATWPKIPDPAPAPRPGPPPPDPYDPFIDDEGHARTPWGGAIEPEAPVQGVVEFLWLEEAIVEAEPFSRLAYDDAGALAEAPIVDTLRQARKSSADPATALTAMRTAAASFVEANWPPTAAQQALAQEISALLAGLVVLPERLDFEATKSLVEETLGVSIDSFWSDQIADAAGLYELVWQLLYALALIPAEGETNAAVMDFLESAGEVVLCARALRLMIALYQGEEEICEPRARRALARALAATPKDILPPPPTPPKDGASVRVLGVGVQKVVEQRLEGYRLGEIAEVVNVMPRERMRTSERERRQDGRVEERRTLNHDETADSRTSQGQSNLISGLRDALSQAEIIRNYQNLDADRGEWPELKIGGSWWGQDGDQRRDIDQAARFVQDLSVNVASTIAAQVVEARSSFELREHESLQTRSIDNRTSHSALRGVYHWLEKVQALRLVSVGRRLTLELSLPSPGLAFSQRAQAEAYLEPPLPPTTWKISTDPSQYDSVTADNYGAAGAAYGLVLAAPPVGTISVRTVLSAQQPSTTLTVPEGFATKGLSLGYVVADTSQPFVALAAAQAITFATSAPKSLALADPSPPSPPPPPSVPNPQGYAWTALKPGSGAGTATFATPLSGDIPVACLYGGGAFSAIAAVDCQLASDSPVLEAWKIETHKTILSAYNALLLGHQAAAWEDMKARVPNGVGRLIADELAVAGVVAVASIAPGASETSPPPALSRFLTDAFDWSEATYAFYPWGAEAAPAPSPVRWTGQMVSDRNDLAWLNSFVQAGSARVLVTVRSGYELPLAFLLAFGSLPGCGQAALVPYAARNWLDNLASGRPLPADHNWTLQTPTAHVALSENAKPWLKATP